MGLFIFFMFIGVLAWLYVSHKKSAFSQSNAQGKGGGGPSEFIAAARSEHAAEVRNSDIPITGVSEEQKEAVRQVMAENTARGASPKDAYGKVKKILTPFEWEDFDKWAKIFRDSGEWPSMWEDLADYYDIKNTATIEELVSLLDKDNLIKLAGQYELKIPKKAKKQEYIDEILKVITEDYKQNVFDLLYPEGEKTIDLNKMKSELLAHSISAAAIEKSKLEDWQKWGMKTAEIVTAPDSCSWCQEYTGKKMKISTLLEKGIPPIHPGCRCSILPVKED